MRRAAAPDLARVMAAEEAGRARGAEILARVWKLRRKAKRAPPRLCYLDRKEAAARALRKRQATIAERERQVDTPIPVPWRDYEATQNFLDEGYNWAERHAQREVRHAITRAEVARRLDERAAWREARGRDQEAERDRRDAEKLRNARTIGWWGFDKMTGRRYMRFRDRSGLVRYDPSEANRDAGRQIRRLVPTLQRHAAAGLLIYKAVFSMPNVPLGALAWGKREIFRMMARAMEAFPEVVGRFDAQEDPLAIDGQSWNVHVNTILVVDPAQCTPLPPELVQQHELQLPGVLGKLPAPPPRDRTPPGRLSYQKLHYVWSGMQVEIRKLETHDADALAKQLAEVIKYAVKFVSQKQLSRALGRADSPAPVGNRHGSLGEHAADAHEGRVPGVVVSVGPGVGGLRAARADLCDDGDAAPGAQARTAPALTSWPLRELDEWDCANRGRRRMRSYGVLYRLDPDELRDPDLDGRIRYCGRVRVEPRGFHVEAGRLSHLDLIHGDKSSPVFGVSAVRDPGGGARAGPRALA